VQPEISVAEQPPKLAASNHGSLTIALIDFYRLTRECLTNTLGDLQPEISISSFMAVKDCVAETQRNFDLIIYYLHGSEVSDATITQTIATIGKAFPAIPVIIFSDADRMQQPRITRLALTSGARGLVPTQTAALPMISAAIHLVQAGGTFEPVDLLIDCTDHEMAKQQNLLTSRQATVLGHLQQGKANKIIAYELGMSESTVKVHVRNIMRKMGATNRTQAAFKAQRLSNDLQGARAIEI
jgi:DNA-binding NarL/FixJ family response regulator